MFKITQKVLPRYFNLIVLYGSTFGLKIQIFERLRFYDIFGNFETLCLKSLKVFFFHPQAK